MTWNYENWLNTTLVSLKSDLGLTSYNIEVATEQAFIKKTTFTPNTIYVVIKFLTSSITFEATTQPVQFIIISEENSMDATRILFNAFAQRYNWFFDGPYDNVYVKHQYSTPAVLSNFNEIGYGYRSTLYISATLYIMENVMEVRDLLIDHHEVKPLAFNMAYAMTGNTQPVGGNRLASTTKSVATLSIAMTVPLTDTELVNNVVNITNGSSTGNKSFDFNFSVGDINIGRYHSDVYADDVLVYADGVKVVVDEGSELNMKLVSAEITTSPQQVPGLQLGFML